MNSRNHEVGFLILICSIFDSSQYYAIISIFFFYMLILRTGVFLKNSRDGLSSLLLMLATGLIFMSNNLLYEVGKDFWYITKVMLFAMAGLMIGFRLRPDTEWLRITAIYGAIAVIIAFMLYLYGGISGATTRFQPNLAAIIILIFYLRAISDKTLKGRWVKWFLAICLSLLIIFSDSRVTLLVSIVAWIGAGSLFGNRLRMTLAALSLAPILFTAAQFLPEYDIQNITFLGKVKNSITEISFVDTNDYEFITANWRGFEAARAYDAWQQGSFAQKIFGQGLGSTIDIGFYYNLSEEYSVRYLPILHNGYLMVLVKYGILGSVFFIAFMLSPFFLPGKLDDPRHKLEKRIGRVASVVLLATTVTIAGPLNLRELDGVVLIMGWAIGRQRQTSLLDRQQVRTRRSCPQKIAV
jgi:hypothetical protein